MIRNIKFKRRLGGGSVYSCGDDLYFVRRYNDDDLVIFHKLVDKKWKRVGDHWRSCGLAKVSLGKELSSWLGK